MDSTLPKFMNLGQTAKFLSVSRNTLTKFIASGLKVSIVNGTKRIDQADAQAFMDAHKI